MKQNLDPHSLVDRRRYWRVPFLPLFVVLLLSAVLLGNLRTALAAAVEYGYRDFSYSGASAPTGQKPQSKLWFNDGFWWGSLFNKASGKFEIYRFNWADQSWTTSGTALDPRRRSSADVMWDGSHLYVVSAFPPGVTGDDFNIYLMRYSYSSTNKSYSQDAGFPISLGNRALESVVMDKDSTGVAWVTYTDTNSSGGRNVYVMHSTSNDLTWTAPYIIPTAGASNLKSDDISSVVSFNGKIGVMWSNQNTDIMYFAIHVDGALDSEWSLNPALQGPKYADDHLNLKSLVADDSGQVFAAVKTSLNDLNPSNPDDPLILLLTLDRQGSWSRRTFGRVADDHTRPIVLIDNQNRKVYVFATVPVGSATAGAIYYKSVSLDNKSMQFPAGLGTPFMLSSLDTHINNSSSTKQSLNNTTKLLVIAGDDTTKYYFHNMIDLGAPASTATPGITATSVIETPTQAPSTATALPTSTDQPTPTNTVVVPSATPTEMPSNTPTSEPLPTEIPSNTPTSEPLPTETPLPSPTLGAATLFEDGFESGNLSAWTTVKTGGDGIAAVQTNVVKSGSFAAMFSETSNSGSLAYARKSLANNPTEIIVSGDFMVTVEGDKGGNVPILRLFNTQQNRIVNLMRLNLNKNKINVQHSGSYFDTSGVLPLNTWGHFEVHTIVNPSGPGTIQVYLDGNLIYETNAANLGSLGIQSLQIGNETAKQTFMLYVDNIIVKR